MYDAVQVSNTQLQYICIILKPKTILFLPISLCTPATHNVNNSEGNANPAACDGAVCNFTRDQSSEVIVTLSNCQLWITQLWADAVSQLLLSFCIQSCSFPIMKRCVMCDLPRNASYKGSLPPPPPLLPHWVSAIMEASPWQQCKCSEGLLRTSVVVPYPRHRSLWSWREKCNRNLVPFKSITCLFSNQIFHRINSKSYSHPHTELCCFFFYTDFSINLLSSRGFWWRPRVIQYVKTPNKWWNS